MKPKTLFDYASMESFRTDRGEGAPARNGRPEFKALGAATEAAHSRTVEQVMREAGKAMTGRRGFRSLLRALRG